MLIRERTEELEKKLSPKAFSADAKEAGGNGRSHAHEISAYITAFSTAAIFVG